ncbi:MAG: transcriptional repressor LexA [Anaerovoracaceae bacterium]|jgi:repressor LexA
MNKRKEREDRILAFMKKEISEKGYPPTVREICAALDIKSTSTVHKDLEALVAEGRLIKDPSKPRALQIVEDEPAGRNSEDRIDVVDVPVIGRIAAGAPILAEENIDDSIPVPARYLGRGTYFMLTVHGESMVEAGIMDGDYVLVEQTETANNGDIVVAMLNGFESEATLKRFYREDGHVRLQPENSDMSPIIVNDCKVLGKARGVFRYF